MSSMQMRIMGVQCSATTTNTSLCFYLRNLLRFYKGKLNEYTEWPSLSS